MVIAEVEMSKQAIDDLLDALHDLQDKMIQQQKALEIAREWIFTESLSDARQQQVIDIIDNALRN